MNLRKMFWRWKDGKRYKISDNFAYFYPKGDFPYVRVGCNKFYENDVANLKAIINLVDGTNYERHYDGAYTDSLVVNSDGIFQANTGSPYSEKFCTLQEATEVIKRFERQI